MALTSLSASHRESLAVDQSTKTMPWFAALFICSDLLIPLEYSFSASPNLEILIFFPGTTLKAVVNSYSVSSPQEPPQLSSPVYASLRIGHDTPYVTDSLPPENCGSGWVCQWYLRWWSDFLPGDALCQPATVKMAQLLLKFCGTVWVAVEFGLLFAWVPALVCAVDPDP